MTTRKNLYIDQGVDYSMSLDPVEVNGVEFDITDQQFYCYAKKIYSTALSFQATITANSATDEIQITIPGTVTEDVDPGKYQYDIIAKTDNTTIKVLEGLLFLLPTVTKVD